MIKAEGYDEAKRQSSKPTFYRHIWKLQTVGLSRAYLRFLLPMASYKT